jgi:tetratricopeptide (TPR) repeat protein
LYKGDSNAAKAAGHELKGVMSYYNCYLPNFHQPLMAIIDYRGFRLSAISLLPIREGRLIYGSDDCGATVFNMVPEFSEKMEKAARILNLASHTIAGQRIHSAYDVEGHEANGKYYLLDLARTFPPELPLDEERASWPPNAFLYRLLRPELVKKSSVPLSSDAGNVVQRSDPNWRNLFRDVRAIKSYLRKDVIPIFAQKLVSTIGAEVTFFEREIHLSILRHLLMKSKWKITLKEFSRRSPNGVFGECFPLKQHMHAEGINMRHMGYIITSIRKAFPDGTQGKQHAIAILFIEMCARTIRQEINAAFQAHMRALAVPLEEPYRLLLVDFLNKIFGNSDASSVFWKKMKLCIIQKFERQNFTDEELSDSFDIRQLMAHDHPSRRESGKFLLFIRLKKLMGFIFDEITEHAAITSLVFYDQPRPFDDIDLRSIGARVKHMGVVNHARGYIYKMRGSDLKDKDFEKATIMLQKARENFEEVLESNPTNFVTLRNCGQVLQQIETINAKKSNCEWLDLENPTVATAKEYYFRAVEVSPRDTHSLYQYAQFLVKCQQNEEAEEYFLRSLEADPKHAAALVDLGVLLIESGYENVGNMLLGCVTEEEFGRIYRI